MPGAAAEAIEAKAAVAARVTVINFIVVFVFGLLKDIIPEGKKEEKGRQNTFLLISVAVRKGRADTETRAGSHHKKEDKSDKELLILCVGGGV